MVPLLKRLKYDPKFEPAFRQVGSECGVAGDVRSQALHIARDQCECCCIPDTPLEPAIRHVRQWALANSTTHAALHAPLQVFGKTLVCRNMDVAAKAAKESNLNCVTMEGDQVGCAVGI